MSTEQTFKEYATCPTCHCPIDVIQGEKNKEFVLHGIPFLCNNSHCAVGSVDIYRIELPGYPKQPETPIN